MKTLIDCMQEIAREYNYDDWEKMCKYLLIDGYPDIIKVRFSDALKRYRSQFESKEEIMNSL